jgi:hypothetical protein
VNGELPIPTRDELVREGQERREEEEKIRVAQPSGPSIIPAIRGDGAATGGEPEPSGEQIPARPDWA